MLLSLALLFSCGMLLGALAQRLHLPPLLGMLVTGIVLGAAGGAVCGLVLAAFFRRVHLRDSMKVLILLIVSFLLVTLEHALTGIIGFSGLLAVMAAGIALQRTWPEAAARLSAKFSKLWWRRKCFCSCWSVRPLTSAMRLRAARRPWP